MYRTSKDYQRLFTLICNGHVAAGWVDYRHNESEIHRDVVQIRRIRPYDIQIHSRGACYNAVYLYEMGRDRNEQTLFVERCHECNLAWIEPSETPAILFNIEEVRKAAGYTPNYDDLMDLIDSFANDRSLALRITKDGSGFDARVGGDFRARLYVGRGATPSEAVEKLLGIVYGKK